MPDAASQSSARSLGQLFSLGRTGGGDGVSVAAGTGPDTQPLGGALKRGLDLVVATASILLLAPMVMLLALLVLLTMGRPIFYEHERVGFQRRPFRCQKFRTMVRDPDAVLARHLEEDPEAAREWSDTRKLRQDPRVTFVGRLLRKSSLDELPQLLNVLRGEMSCVGPRPVVEDELARYGTKAPLYLSARPGMTGLWQVSGRSSVDYARRVALDERYVCRWSIWLDLKILLDTIFVIVAFNDAA